MILNTYGWLGAIKCMNDGHIHVVKKKREREELKNNLIFYTTIDGNIYDMEEAINAFITTHPGTTSALSVISNEYIDGIGIVTFDSDVLNLGYKQDKSTGNYIWPTFNVLSNEDPESEFVDNILTVTLPDLVDSFGSYSFYGCSHMKYLFVPKSISLIENGALLSLLALETIVVDSNNERYDSRNDCNAVIDTLNECVIRGCINTVIPDDVVAIGNNAFSYCYGLEHIDLHDNITDIGEYTFSYCSSLKEIAIPESCTKIADGVFWYCNMLDSVLIHSNIELIGKDVFYDCLSLTEVTFDGTKSQWNDLVKEENWNRGSVIAKVVCTDGDIIL